MGIEKKGGSNMSKRDRVYMVKTIKQALTVQTDEIIKAYFENFQASDYSKSNPNDIRVYADHIHYAYILRDYLTASWAFTQYSFKDEEYGEIIYDISDELIEYMYLGHIYAIDILNVMMYKKPWYGPIDDRFINNHVLTIFHRIAATRIKVKGESK